MGIQVTSQYFAVKITHHASDTVASESRVTFYSSDKKQFVNN